MLLEVPESALRFGFMNDPIGTHGSRTMMLKELTMLLLACPRPTGYEDFRTAIVDDNVLMKNTLSTRKESFRRLRELYALDEGVLLFRALRDLWEQDPEGQPLIALLCVTARDPILRASAEMILSIPRGETVTPQMIEKTTVESFPGRYNPTMRANVGRHAASTWEQSGHLEGHRHKVRSQTTATPASTAYALLLGHLCGNRGETLFTTLWAQLLDVSISARHDLAEQAGRMGWLEYRHAGDVTEITFDYLLREGRHSEE